MSNKLSQIKMGTLHERMFNLKFCMDITLRNMN